jgi:DNA-binding LacI/PurR family transcriptional regulator
MSTTMRDVAVRAGVSVKTVSNVVNDFPHVRPTTRGRVLAAIDELGYQMNFTARSLSLGRTGMITLAVPKLRLPYFAELADEVIGAAEARGYTVLIEQTGGSRDREIELLTSERRRMTDGLILSPSGLGAGDAPRLEAGSPVVLLGERSLHARVHHVVMPNEAGARAVTEHLLAAGRRRIALLGHSPGDGEGAGHLRARGFHAALSAAGVRHDPARTIGVREWTLAAGATAMAALLDRRVELDAVLGLNDVLALGAMRTLFERGLRVPDDVAVAGFDDIEESRFARPSLTTVRPDRTQIARRAVDLLVDGFGSATGGTAAAEGPPGPGAASALGGSDPGTRDAGPDPETPHVADFELRVRESSGARTPA